MPELPEVETVRRQLLPLYQGKTIDNIVLRTPYLLKNAEPELFCNILRGKRLNDILRHGKFLTFVCEDLYPVFHLGMSGIFLSDRANSLYPQHIHVDIEFDDGSMLYFQDMRKFGKIWLYEDVPDFPTLGLDPINDTITLDRFREMLGQRGTAIKLFLMDQAHIAGIGNIYASEILHDAHILPKRPVKDLTNKETEALWQSITKILDLAIEKFGTSYSAYRTVSGETGDNQNFLQVYQRNDKPCYRCGEVVQKVVMGSRSTFYCEGCQN